MNRTSVEIKFIDKELYLPAKNELAPDVELSAIPPRYQTPGAAAVDLLAAEPALIAPGETVAIRTGMAISILNESCCALILPRSGLGKKGLVLANLSGLIDSDYQGELQILAWNRLDREDPHGQAISVSRGDRIAQMLFLPVLHAEWNIVNEFSVETERGEGGFGSTGGAGFLTVGQVKKEIEKRG